MKMNSLRSFLFIVIGVVPCLSSEPIAKSKDGIQPVTGSWGSGSSRGSSRRESRLDSMSQDDLAKTTDLEFPVAVTILEKGRAVDGLEDISDRIVDVRITNPNSYPIFFQGRQYKENKTIKPRWRTLEEGHWVDAGWDWCGTGVRDWDIEANGSIEVMLYLHPELTQQQILGRFYKADRASIQSDCLLYEKK